jgi:hypothetical protein
VADEQTRRQEIKIKPVAPLEVEDHLLALLE